MVAFPVLGLMPIVFFSKLTSVLIPNCLCEFGHAMSPRRGLTIFFEAMISINISPLTGFKHLDSHSRIAQAKISNSY